MSEGTHVIDPVPGEPGIPELSRRTPPPGDPEGGPTGPPPGDPKKSGSVAPVETAPAGPAAPPPTPASPIDVEQTSESEGAEPPLKRPRLTGRTPGTTLKKPAAKPGRGGVPSPTPAQRLLLLDTWRRSGLPAREFAGLVGVWPKTLWSWKKRFEEGGPAGLEDRPKGAPVGSRLPEVTQRTILMLKENNPDWGCQRISDMLVRGPALPASPNAVARVLREAGYELAETPTAPHPDHPREFERARANQLWQTDLFTFLLKRQNRRVYLVAFLDDHSRFIVSYGLYASPSTALVMEVLRAGIASHGAPEEVLTDNGPQYVTWRGKSAFSRELDKRGIKQIVSAPRHPQTLGKVERFWGTLWRECLEAAVFLDLEDARRRIGLFIDHYNFQRPHQGIDSLVPADRFFGAAPEVLKTLKARVAENALAMARQGIPKPPFYVTGRVGDQPFSLHAEGEKMILTKEDGRQEVDLVKPPAAPAPELPAPLCPHGAPPETGPASPDEPPAPGTSPVDEAIRILQEGEPS